MKEKGGEREEKVGKRVKGEGKELNIGTNLKKGKNMLLGYEKKINFPGK